MNEPILSTTEPSSSELDFSQIIDKDQDTIFFTLSTSFAQMERAYQKALLKDDIHLRLINNLFKKVEFLQLYIQLCEEQISDEEFERTINKNPEKYIINIEKISHSEELHIMIDMAKKFPKELSIDEFTELFGIEAESLSNIPAKV